MKSLLKRVLTASLALTLSVTPLARADGEPPESLYETYGTEEVVEKEIKQADLSLNTSEQNNLSEFIKQCELDKKNLASTQSALDHSLEHRKGTDPVPIIGAVIASFIIGFGAKSLMK